MSQVWRTATDDALTALDEGFKSYREMKVTYDRCGDPELIGDAHAEIDCAITLEYRPKAGRASTIRQLWQFELEWVDGRWQMTNWRR